MSAIALIPGRVGRLRRASMDGGGVCSHPSRRAPKRARLRMMLFLQNYSHLKRTPPAGTLPAKSGAGWTMSTFDQIIVESKGAVGIVTLNRPKMLNALSFGVFREIAAAVDDLEADDAIGCILVTGSEKAFAAGADIKEMQPKTFIDMFSSDFAAIGGDRIATLRKTTIAAVHGHS